MLPILFKAMCLVHEIMTSISFKYYYSYIYAYILLNTESIVVKKATFHWNKKYQLRKAKS